MSLYFNVYKIIYYFSFQFVFIILSASILVHGISFIYSIWTRFMIKWIIDGHYLNISLSITHPHRHKQQNCYSDDKYTIWRMMVKCLFSSLSLLQMVYHLFHFEMKITCKKVCWSHFLCFSSIFLIYFRYDQWSMHISNKI